MNTQAQLLAAVTNSLPGDEIVVAPGTYLGGIQMPVGKGGTAAHPLVIRCARGAVIDRGGYSAGFGLRVRGPFVQVHGCAIRNAQFGVWAEGASDAVFDGLDVRDIGQNAYVIRSSDRTYSQRGTISNVGLGSPAYAEGIYGGHSSDATQMSDDVKVLGTRFGPEIRDEHIDIKGLSGGRSDRWLVQGNHFDATGTRFNAVPAVNAVVMDQGAADTRYLDNVVVNLNSAGLSAFAAFTSLRPVFHRNEADPARNRFSGAQAFRVMSPTTDPKIYCDNVGPRNVTCTP